MSDDIKQAIERLRGTVTDVDRVCDALEDAEKQCEWLVRQKDLAEQRAEAVEKDTMSEIIPTEAELKAGDACYLLFSDGLACGTVPSRSELGRVIAEHTRPAPSELAASRRVRQCDGFARLLPVECRACKASKVKRGDLTPAHIDHWKCSGCDQKYRQQSIMENNPKSVYAITVKFCPACGGQFEPNAPLELQAKREDRP